MTSKITIIGSGLSSAVLSKKFNENEIQIFDKSRGPGGRSSTRRVENIGVFDHGLQFISPKDEKFELFLSNNLNNFIKIWQGQFVCFEENTQIKKKKYIGKLGNNDFVKNLIKAKVHYQKELVSIKKINNYWISEFKDGSIYESKILILTIPLEQCKKFLEYAKIDIKLKGCMEPNLTTMVAFDKNLKISGSGFKFNNNSILGWVANESSKLREANNPNLELWTLQSSLIFAKKNIQEYRLKKEQIMNLMIDEFINIFNIKNINIVHKDIHGWLYAYKLEKFENDFFWDQEINLGICGDWMCGSTAESAWRSATGLADQINKS
jgi:predicted NAD/FAD-dependent oxidoreductase